MIFIISGPSGSGKTTLLEQLLKTRQLKGKLARSISFTTRPRRSGERDGKGYFFISEREFKEKLKAKKFLEWTRYLGYYYATPADFLERQLKKGKHPILCLDLKGAARLKQLYPKNTRTIFIVPPSLETLRDRIERRCRKTQKKEISRRLRLAQRELSVSRKYDYSIVNKNLIQAVKDLKNIILREVKFKQ